MVDLSSIIQELGKWIDDRRLRHSIGVSRCASQLAARYGGDKDKAELAGLVHDCAKNLSLEESLRLGEKYAFVPDEISLKNKALLHAPLGAFLAEELFNIEDAEILAAIACHTTGKKNMSLLEKVIFLADYIEPDRSYPGVDKIRALAFVDLNRALLLALELSIRNVLERGRLLHPMTADARNSLIIEITGTDLTQTRTASLKNQNEIEGGSRIE